MKLEKPFYVVSRKFSNDNSKRLFLIIADDQSSINAFSGFALEPPDGYSENEIVKAYIDNSHFHFDEENFRRASWLERRKGENLYEGLKILAEEKIKEGYKKKEPEKLKKLKKGDNYANGTVVKITKEFGKKVVWTEYKRDKCPRCNTPLLETRIPPSGSLFGSFYCLKCKKSYDRSPYEV